MKLKPLLTTIALALGATLIPKNANSYAVKSENGDPSIHPLLVEKLKELYQPPTGIKFNTKTVKQGAIEEDSPESVYTRSYNHFISWENSDDGLWSFPSSKKWAQSSELQGGPIPFDKFPEPLRAYYVALYSGTEGIYPYGDNSWPRVKEDYAQGEIGIPFGHIFHLICDATVPAHVRMDPHFGDSAFLEQLTEGSYFQVSLWPSDAYEVWTDEHKGKIMDWLAPKKGNIPQFDSLDALFEDLAKFTGSNFYSDDRVDGTVKDLEEITEGKKVFFMKEVDGKYVHVLRKGFFSDFPDTKCLEDEWIILGTKSVEYGAAALKLLAKENCKSECSQKGQKVCDGNGWKECEDFNDDGCLEWGEINDCLSSEYCGEGACHAQEMPDTISYPDTYISPDTYVSPDSFTKICTPGKIEAVSTCWNGATKEFKKCSSDGIEWNYGTDDCWHSDCEGSVCMPAKGDTPDTCNTDEECAGCVDDCVVNGFYSCSDSGTFWYKCGEYDNDSCKDLTKVNCVPGESCNESTKGCEPSCVDECVSDPATAGLYCESNKIMLCGYEPGDKCLTASVFVECSGTCVDLQCVEKTCEDECAASKDKTCSGNYYLECKTNFDTDSCLDYKYTDCGTNTCTPGNGCVASCTPECTAAENKTCSGSNYIECYNKDTDSCLEKTVKACAAGTTCTPGKGCVSNLPCSDQCFENGKKYCADKYNLAVCGQFDDDECMDLLITETCSGGELCNYAKCNSITQCKSNLYFQCNEGDVWWYNSCGEKETVFKDCTENQVCKVDWCCTPQSYQSCYEGDVYWFDSCNNPEELIQSCNPNETYCFAAGCKLFKTEPSCTSHVISDCKDNDVYWKDSCGNFEDKKEECGANGCANKACVGGGTCDIKSGCSDADCVFYDDFSGSSLDTICKWGSYTDNPAVAGGYLHLKEGEETANKDGVNMFYGTPCQGGDFTLEHKVKFNAQDAYAINLSGILGPYLLVSSAGVDKVALNCAPAGAYEIEIEGIDLTQFNTIILEGKGQDLTLSVNGITKTATCNSSKELLSLWIGGLANVGSEVLIDYLKIKCK